jgi:hypothetical protein
VTDLTPVRGMPLEELSVEGGAVRDLDPLRGLPLKTFTLLGCDAFTSAEPLRGMACTSLNLGKNGNLTDIAALEGMPCKAVNFADCVKLENLEPLRGMPLARVTLHNCSKLKDLGPLRGMPVPYVVITGTAVTDVSPLAESPLVELHISTRSITAGMEALRKIETLKWIVPGTSAPALPVAEFWKRYDAGEYKPKPK